jgi:hypothetical protein
MYRLSVTVTLVSFLLAGSAQASIGRTQGFQIGALNQVEWAGGIGSAQGENQGSFTQTQQVSDHASGLSARQRERGSLTQTATAGGTGFSTARQTAAIKGSQDLLADTTKHGSSSRGEQELEVKLDTRLFRPIGIGTVSGTQHYTGAQGQTVTTPAGTSSQSQCVDVRQSGSITTMTNIDPTVKNTININLHQTQTTGGR